MSQKLTKLLAFTFFIFLSLHSFSVDLTYSSGAWSPNAPSASTSLDNVIIDDVDCVMPDGAKMTNLTINSGSSVTVSTEDVTVLGNLTIFEQGSYVITGTGTLTVSGTASIDIPGSSNIGAYQIWSSPFADGSLDIPSTFSATNPCDILVYQASTQEWKADYTTGHTTTCVGQSVTFTASSLNSDGAADGKFDIGRGYFIAGSAPPTKTLSSSGSNLNSGNISFTGHSTSISIAGGNDWNLAGNPYISGVDADDFFAANSGITAVYLYNGSSYDIFTNGGGDVIPAAQGFYYDLDTPTDGTTTLNFTNAMRTTNNVSFRSSSSRQVSFLSLSGNGMQDMFRVIMHEDCEDGKDRKYDSRKILNDTRLNFASFIEFDPNNGPETAAIEGLKPFNDGETKIVSLFVQTDDIGTYEINLDSLENMHPGMSFILEDRDLAITTDLRSFTYSFNSPIADTFNSRFFLHISFDASVTSVPVLENTHLVSVYVSNENLNITALGSDTRIENVQILDILGKSVYSNTYSDKTISIPTTGLTQGVYIVKTLTDSGYISSQKILVQ